MLLHATEKRGLPNPAATESTIPAALGRVKMFSGAGRWEAPVGLEGRHPAKLAGSFPC